MLSLERIFKEKPQLSLFEKDLAQGRLSQSYLLAGDVHWLMQFSVALARVLYCSHKPNLFEACGFCSVCKKITEGKFSSVHLVEPSGKANYITIESVKQMQDMVQLRPLEGNTWFVVVRDVDRMDVEAANAFLKILEEPPSSTLFVLLTHNRYAVLDTVASRCQVISLGDCGETLKSKYSQEPWKNLREQVIEELFEKPHQDAYGLLVDKWNNDLAAIRKKTDKGSKECLEFIYDTIETMIRDVLVFLETGDEDMAFLNRDQEALILAAGHARQTKPWLEVQHRIQVNRQNLAFNPNVKTVLGDILSPLME